MEIVGKKFRNKRFSREEANHSMLDCRACSIYRAYSVHEGMSGWDSIKYDVKNSLI